MLYERTVCQSKVKCAFAAIAEVVAKKPERKTQFLEDRQLADSRVSKGSQKNL
jgi:hypothetical protein